MLSGILIGRNETRKMIRFQQTRKLATLYSSLDVLIRGQGELDVGIYVLESRRGFHSKGKTSSALRYDS